MKKGMKLGQGGRFQKLKGQLSKKGATNPGALAAYIGRKKYGAKKFASLSKKGKKRTEPEKGETMKHEKGESKSYEAKEKDRKRKRAAPKQGQPVSDTRTTLKYGPLRTQNKLVTPVMKLKKAMMRMAKHG